MGYDLIKNQDKVVTKRVYDHSNLMNILDERNVNQTKIGSLEQISHLKNSNNKLIRRSLIGNIVNNHL